MVGADNSRLQVDLWPKSVGFFDNQYSGVTMVGVTRAGTDSVTPIFSWKKTGDFLLITVTFIDFTQVSPLDGVITHLFTCPTSFVHYFIVNSATIFFRSGVIPREGVTRDGSPPSRPPQWRHWIGSCFTVIRRTRFMFAVMLMADGPSFLYKKLLRETWHKKLVYKSHTEPPMFLVRETWTMTETIKNFKFYFFFRIALHDQQNGQKDETTNNKQQQNIVKKTKRTSNQ